jgi:hypothetical protein
MMTNDDDDEEEEEFEEELDGNKKEPTVLCASTVGHILDKFAPYH